mgnify:CR=1 FL=1
MYTKQVIFKMPSCDFFMNINDGANLTQIFKSSKAAAYYIIFNYMNIFQENRLIKTKKLGKERRVYLTERGKLLKDYLNEINGVLNEK